MAGVEVVQQQLLLKDSASASVLRTSVRAHTKETQYGVPTRKIISQL